MSEKMAGGTFSEQTLADKLVRLNNSAQCIETLSNWCIYHRKKARQVVETWERQFNSATKDQQVSYLYLANDILQNSKRKGSEFVNEFWKVLPKSLKNVYENGDDGGKKVVARLIGIWDERRVFGSRGQGLKDGILGDVPILVEKNGRSANINSNLRLMSDANNSNPIKVVRKDSSTIRIKMAVGGMPEKIVTAYQALLEEHSEEDNALKKCKHSVSALEKMEQDISDACNNGNLQESIYLDLQEQETILKLCVNQLEGTDNSRAILIEQLKEALKEEESKMGLVHSQLLIARAEIDRVIRLRQQLSSMVPAASVAVPTGGAVTSLPFTSSAGDPSSAALRPISPQFPAPQLPLTVLAGVATSADDDKKKAAAEVAAKLAASTSSAQVLTSILSSLVAEEAASKSGGTSVAPPGLPAEKRPRLENSVFDSSSLFPQAPPGQQQASLPPTSAALANQTPPMFTPPLPPLPPLAPPLMQQYSQSNGMVGMPPFPILGGLPPPPPPLLPLGFPRQSMPPPPPSTPPPPQAQQQQPPPLPPQQRPPGSTGFFHSPGAGIFGQVQAAPSVQRQ